MASKLIPINHYFSGGWATDFGPIARVQIGQDGSVNIPFLTDAENVFYELDGGPHKVPGTTQLNSTTVDSGEQIRGLVDFWRQGTSGKGTQKRVIHAGTQIFKDDADGTFDSIDTGLEDGTIPAYAIFDDVLIISSDSTTDVPQKWDQTTLSTLGTNTPNFAFSVEHKNRLWAAGVRSTPSTLHFSPLLDPDGDWTGAGSGTIQISPDDGDRITAIASHQNELWVFKGPFIGSIHRIVGSAPTGSDSFARRTFIKGLGAAAHNTIFRFRNDLGFMWSDGTIHSLSAVQAFGDFKEADLSRAINTFLRGRVNKARLDQAWAATDHDAGRVVFTFPLDNSTDNNAMLFMDYRFDPVRFSFVDAYSAACVARVIDQTDRDTPVIMAGGNDGFVRLTNGATRSVDTTIGISARVNTPFMDYNTPINKKTLAYAGLSIVPKGNFDITFSWTRDEGKPQTRGINQKGGDVLGTVSANNFILDTSTLGGSNYASRYVSAEQGGEFRAIQYGMTNSIVAQDMEIHSVTSVVGRGSDSYENC